MAYHRSSPAAETVVASCFELRFWWADDRWRHEVVATGLAVSLPRIVAVESPTDSASQHRVVSPTYQQIHLDEDRATGTVRAFLVGQSGPHHFSAAFLIEEHGHDAGIDVDVADRCRQPIEALAATYHVEPSAGTWSPTRHSAQADQSALCLTGEAARARLCFEADQPASSLIDEAGHGAVRVQALAQLQAQSQTHRLRYRWRWRTDPAPLGDRLT